MPIVDIKKLILPECSSSNSEECLRYVGQKLDFRIFVGEEGSESPFDETNLPDRFAVSISGRTNAGFNLLGNYVAEATTIAESLDGFQLDFKPTETDYEFLQECLEEGVPALCGEEAFFACCPVNGSGNYSDTRSWLDAGTYEIQARLERDEDGQSKTICSGTLTVNLERETEDPRLQPFNVLNASSGDQTGLELDKTHATWHETRDGMDLFPGEDWLLFHYALVKVYDDWRAFYGYPPIRPWSGAGGFPTDADGYTLANLSRPGSIDPQCEYAGSDALAGCTPPGWFTAAGTGSVRPNNNAPGNLPCFKADGSDAGGGQTELGDFADSTSLGCIINRTHHAAMHQAIPGAMRWVNESPYDEIFWSYHKWASSLSTDPDGGTSLQARGPSGDPPGAWAQWEIDKAAGPPGITAVAPPGRMAIGALPSVLVILWEPVEGLDASDLTVNGSPATEVEKNGLWYFFSGFADPTDGVAITEPLDVTVEIAADAFADLEGNGFPGEFWTYTIGPDTDGDLIPDLRDNCIDVPNPDQTNSDADLVHGFHAHPGMEPIYGASGDDQGDACDIDDDNDGLSDELETQVGTDPKDPSDPDACPNDPNKYQPGACGCNASDENRDGAGAIVCIPPITVATTTTTMPPIECLRPLSDGPTPTATDCLFILRVAVGLDECFPACACAPTGSLPTKASDALQCLATAVGTISDILCPCPDLF